MSLILLVEDEPLVASTLARTLRSENYEVLLAENGREGLETYRARRGDIAAILLDLHLPVLSGADMLAAIRASDKETKVIAITGHDLERELEGIDGILYKPFGPAAMLQALRGVLETSGRTAR